MNILDRLLFWRRRASPLPQPRPTLPSISWFRGPSEVTDLLAPSKEHQLELYAGWVRSAVGLIASDVRASAYGLYDVSGGKKAKVEDHEVLDIIERPNALQTWPEFVELTQINLDITGEAFWHIITGANGRVVGVEFVPPTWVVEPEFQDGRHAGWTVQPPGTAQRVMLPRDDVVFIRYPHPSDPYVGASPLAAVAVSQYFDLYLRARGAALMRNDAGIPPGILTTKEEITDEEAQILKERWMDRYKYMTTGGIAVLGSGATFQPIQIPMADLRFLELGRFNRDFILGVYGVPASKLGNVEDVNRANAEENDRTYRMNSLAPRLRRIQDAVNMYLMPRLLGSRSAARRLKFEFVNPVEDDPKLVAERMLEGLKNAAVEVNEFRRYAGLPEVPWGAAVLVPSGYWLMPSPNKKLSAPIGPKAGNVEQPAMRSKAEQLPDTMGQEEKLELVALRFLAEHDPIERTYKSQIRAQFSKEQKAVIAALPENVVPVSARDWYDDVLDQYQDEWEGILFGIYVKGIAAGWELLAKELSPDVLQYADYIEAAKRYAREQAVEKAKGIIGTTKERIKELIAHAIEEGWDQAQLKNAINEVFDTFKGSRAQLIARTETTAAISYGKQFHVSEIARRLGLRFKKRWSAVNDLRTRPTHAFAHGQAVDLNEPFVVGGVPMMHPGDPSAPARETANCRCTVVYETIKERA